MKWIGLALLVFGALLALDHRNWFVPVAFGAIILSYWFFVEQESDGTPPDKSDYLHRHHQSTSLQESSTSLDLPDLAPFLQRLLVEISGSYNGKSIVHVANLASRMKHDEERCLQYEVVFQRQHVPLRISLFKDDADEITICFQTVKPLADFIDAEMASLS